jgi:S1-C subfamily serine protease
MAAATAAAGAQVATAITTSGATASTAITTAGTAMAQAIIAAGQAAAAAISAAVGGGGLLKLLPFRHGGVLKGLRIMAAQAGLVAQRPLLAALAEVGGTELALPLPRGLRPEDLARWVRTGALAERGGVREGDVHVHFNAPLAVTSTRDVQRVAQAVGDAVRWARRGFHPVMREGR